MLQQIKQSIVTQLGENPQFTSTLLGKRIKQHSKKKKEFKIKKSKINEGKNRKKQEGFSNPIYAGLDTEDMQNDNRLNFGPWVQEEMKKRGSQLRENKKYSEKIGNFPTQRRYSYYQTQNMNQNGEYFQKYQSLSSRYNRTSTQDLRMLQTKRGRQFKQLRCSSLMLDVSKSVTLSPIRPLKIKQSQLNKFSKSKSSSVQLLKYKSMKYLFPTNEKSVDTNNLVLKKPNAVIYNYCCSTFDNNLFSSDIDTLLLNRKTTNTPILDQLKQKFTQSRFKNSFRQTQTLLPIKISINKQLYDDLIKKKSKLK